MRGLLGRDGLEPGTGMLIDTAPSVHMFVMRFQIDVGRGLVGALVASRR